MSNVIRCPHCDHLIEDRFVAELLEEHQQVLDVAHDFVDLVEDGEQSYLSDGAMHGLYARFTRVVDSAERAGRMPARSHGTR
jgi:hypothetical protein